MAVIIKENQFHLRTKNTSYVISVYKDKWLMNLYWGKALSDEADFRHCPDDEVYPRPIAFQVPVEDGKINVISDMQMEFATTGYGDYRIPAFHARYEDGSSVTRFVYKSHKVYDGKKTLEGLPAVYTEDGDNVQTLEIELVDEFTGLHAYLVYNVFEDYDVITRNVRYENKGRNTIHILSAQTAAIDMFPQKYKMLNLYGEWARERSVEWQEVKHGITGYDSKRGMSSHMFNPCLTLADINADENMGNIYSMSLVYSGEFEAKVEKSSCGGIRMSLGINSFDFDWELKGNDVFQTPEAVMVYSGNGLNAMSGIYHKLYRERLCRGIHRDEIRPLLINSWEGIGKDCNEEKIKKLSLEAKEIGCEMVVIDAGWFKILGDWVTDKDKFPNGWSDMREFFYREGLKFGIWFEPEMIELKSDIYINHPDWCLHCDGRDVVVTHNRVVLDLGRKEVVDCLVDRVSKIIDETKVDYIKWDCNRNIVETQTSSQRHKYVLGLYELIEILRNKYPNILFESCSGGGGRFDAGMLYYMPQVWTSDNTTAIDRMKIQYGTSIYYPPITMGSHIGVIDMGYDRYNKLMNSSATVAMAGNFGYEFDLGNLSEKEKEQVKAYSDTYKKIRKTIQFGDFYRIESPFDGDYTSWAFTDDDYVVLFTYQSVPQVNGEERRIRIPGVDMSAKYECNGRIYSGEELSAAGIRIPITGFDYESKCFIFKKCN